MSEMEHIIEEPPLQESTIPAFQGDPKTTVSVSQGLARLGVPEGEHAFTDILRQCHEVFIHPGASLTAINVDQSRLLIYPEANVGINHISKSPVTVSEHGHANIRQASQNCVFEIWPNANLTIEECASDCEFRVHAGGQLFIRTALRCIVQAETPEDVTIISNINPVYPKTTYEKYRDRVRGNIRDLLEFFRSFVP